MHGAKGVHAFPPAVRTVDFSCPLPQRPHPACRSTICPEDRFFTRILKQYRQNLSVRYRRASWRRRSSCTRALCCTSYIRWKALGFSALRALEKVKSNMQEVRARGGELFVFADLESHFHASEGVNVIRTPRHFGALSPWCMPFRCNCSRIMRPCKKARMSTSRAILPRA
jgi:hypothetical protein